MFPPAVILAVCDLLDCHPAATGPHGPCCPPWGAATYTGLGNGTVPVYHYVLGEVTALPVPVPAVGRVGLWRPDPDLAAAITAALPLRAGTG